MIKRLLYVIAALALVFTFVAPAKPAQAATERYGMIRVFYDTNANGTKDTGESYVGTEFQAHALLSYNSTNCAAGWTNSGVLTASSTGHILFFEGIANGPRLCIVNIQIDQPTSYYWTVTTSCPTQISFAAYSPDHIYQVVGIHTGCSGE